MIHALTTAAALALAAAAPQDTRPPYVLAWTGDLDEARAALVPRPGALPTDAEGLFLLACVELEADRLDAAAAAVARLVEAAPADPAPRVLTALLARRRAAPGERMTDALIEAWSAAGRPDLSAGGVLARLASPASDADLYPGLGAEALSRLTPAEAFLLADSPAARQRLRDRSEAGLAGVQRHAEEVRAQAMALLAQPGPRPVALDLAIHSWLDEGEARRALAASLAGSLPENGLFPIMAALEATAETAPLTAAELDAIEAAVARPRLTPPGGLVLAETRRVAAKVDPRHAALLAIESCWRLPGQSLALVKLARRAKATTEPTLRARAGLALERAAGTLAADPTTLGRMIGFILGKTAAQLAGDGPLDRDIGERGEAWMQKVSAARKALALVDWPLASLRQEWDPDGEAALSERLVR